MLALAQPRGLGLGDVKLAGLLGLHTAWLSWTAWYVSFSAGVLAAGLWALTLILAGRPRASSIAFGPFLLVGSLAAVLVVEASAVALGTSR